MHKMSQSEVVRVQRLLPPMAVASPSAPRHQYHRMSDGTGDELHLSGVGDRTSNAALLSPEDRFTRAAILIRSSLAGRPAASIRDHTSMKWYQWYYSSRFRMLSLLIVYIHLALGLVERPPGWCDPDWSTSDKCVWGNRSDVTGKSQYPAWLPDSFHTGYDHEGLNSMTVWPSWATSLIELACLTFYVMELSFKFFLISQFKPRVTLFKAAVISLLLADLALREAFGSHSLTFARALRPIFLINHGTHGRRGAAPLAEHLPGRLEDC